MNSETELLRFCLSHIYEELESKGFLTDDHDLTVTGENELKTLENACYSIIDDEGVLFDVPHISVEQMRSKFSQVMRSLVDDDEALLLVFLYNERLNDYKYLRSVLALDKKEHQN